MHQVLGIHGTTITDRVPITLYAGCVFLGMLAASAEGIGVGIWNFWDPKCSQV